MTLIILFSCVLPGHYIVLYMSVYTYIAEITAVEERSFRIGLVVVINTMFNLIGSAIGRQVVRKLGYTGTFSVVSRIMLGRWGQYTAGWV